MPKIGRTYFSDAALQIASTIPLYSLSISLVNNLKSGGDLWLPTKAVTLCD